MAKTFVKCPKCGWFDGENYHVCYKDNGGPKTTVELTKKEKRTVRRRAVRNSVNVDVEAQQESMANAREYRWNLSDNVDRNNIIVEKYQQGGVGYKDLAKEFNLSYSTIVQIMKKAKDAGIVTPRVGVKIADRS